MWSRIGARSLRRGLVPLGPPSSSRAISTEAPRKRFVALWGNGDYGRLGLGSVESQWRPVACSKLESESIRAVSCGGAHTLFLTGNGRVYATGLNDFGQLGVSYDKNYTVEPLEVCGFGKEIVQISAGYHHSSAITVDGELYMWGKNSQGQLGLGKRAPTVVPVPSKIDCLIGIAIKMAALGSEHSVAVTEEGKVLSWGEGGMGRLGHDHESSIFGIFKSSCEYTPRLIKKLEGLKVKSAAAGLLHTACVDDNGSVFIFGEKTVNKFVKGSGEVNNVATPSMMTGLPFSEDVACGGYHTCVITYGGELYAWGSNENGCLGIGCTESIYLPERVQGPFVRYPVSKVSCGWKHTAAISEGKIFTWGWGGSHGTFSDDGHSSGGQLGQGHDFDIIEPTIIEFKNTTALQVSCGFNHTGAILEYT